MKAYKSMPHYVAVVLQIVCNNVDKYAAVIDNNCIRYTTATSKGKCHYLSRPFRERRSRSEESGTAKNQYSKSST